jgi:hypothetical protein
MPRLVRPDGLPTSQTINVNFRMSMELHRQIKLLCLDPHTGMMPPYGWSRVVEEGLRLWLEKQKVNQPLDATDIEWKQC